MPRSARDIVVFEAVQAEWIASGLPEIIPNGIFWGDPIAGTQIPYCEFVVENMGDTGLSNKSVYRDYEVTFRVHHTDPAEAVNLVDDVAIRMEDAMFALPLDQGKIYSVDRGNSRPVREDEVTYAGMVEFKIRRIVPYTRPSRA